MSHFPEGDLLNGNGGGSEEQQPLLQNVDAAYGQQRFAFEGKDSVALLMKQLHAPTAAAATPAYSQHHQVAQQGGSTTRYERPGLTTEALAQEVVASMAAQQQDHGGGAPNFAPNVNQLQQDLDKARATDLVRRTAEMGSGIVGDDANTIDAIVSYSFRWTGNQSPSDFVASADTMSKAFSSSGHEGIDFTKTQFVHSLDILQTFNTSKLPLAFQLGGIRNKDVTYVHKMGSSDAYTFLVPPGRWEGRETVHRLTDASLDMLVQHGNVDLDKEADNVQFLRGTDLVFVDPETRLGMVLKLNQSDVTNDPNGLLPLMEQLPLYLVPWAEAKNVLDVYHKKIISKLPSSALDKHTAKLVRFDRPTTSTAPLGDVSDAPGLTPTEKDQEKARSQMVTIVARLRLINPNKLLD